MCADKDQGANNTLRVCLLIYQCSSITSSGDAHHQYRPFLDAQQLGTIQPVAREDCCPHQLEIALCGDDRSLCAGQ